MTGRAFLSSDRRRAKKAFRAGDAGGNAFVLAAPAARTETPAGGR